MCSPHLRTFTFLLIVPLLLLLLTYPSAAQDASPQAFPLKILLLDESLTPPGLSTFIYPYNFAFSLGTEYTFRSDQNDGLHVEANVGGYFHETVRNAAFVNFQLGYRYRIERFSASLRAGPGLALAFATGPVYEFDNGDYREARNGGTLIFMPAATFELGYRLGPSPISPELLLHYGFALDSPFGLLPIPHTFAGLGVAVHCLSRK